MIDIRPCSPAEALARHGAIVSRWEQLMLGGHLVPRQLPGPPAHFVNRRRELAVLDTKLRGQGHTPSIVVLKGAGGMGKSSVALHWLHQALDHFPDGQLYAVLAQPTGAPVAVEDVLGGFLRALGVVPDRVPPTVEERAALFRSVTANRSLAVLLEDAMSAQQVRSLLPASTTSVVAVTSRRALPGLITDGAAVVEIDPLDAASSADLFRRHVGVERVEAERGSTDALIALCGGMPIALCVLAAQLALRPSRPAARLVEELRDEQQRLDVLSVDEEASVRSTLDVSYRGLYADVASVYRVLGLHPGSWVCPEMVAATLQIGRHRAGQHLDALVDASLLTEVVDGGYQCHDLVRAHARTVSAEQLTSEQQTVIVRTLLEWHLFVAQAAGRTLMPSRPFPSYEFPTFPRYQLPPAATDYEGALTWLERHRLDLAAAVRLAVEHEEHRVAYVLGDAMQPLFIVHKHHREAAEVNDRALTAALAMGDPDAEVNMRKRLAHVLIRLGETDAARHHIDQIFVRAREHDDRRIETSGLECLARLQTRLGQHHLAVATHKQNVAIRRELGRPRSEALALTGLGNALLDLGDPAAAVTPLGQARTILVEIDPPDPYNSARATVTLGRAFIRLGDHASARQYLSSAREILSALRSDYQLGQTYEALAELHVALGEDDQAREYRVQANELLAKITDPTTGSASG